MFSHVFTVFRRELEAYFNAAIAYIFIIVFILLNGGLFMNQFFLVGLADMRPFFGLLPFVLAIFLPAVTMRLWAEERRGNTLELLLTFPMGTHELVIGKFLAGLVFYVAALASTFTLPIMLKFLTAVLRPWTVCLSRRARRKSWGFSAPTGRAKRLPCAFSPLIFIRLQGLSKSKAWTFLNNPTKSAN